MLLDTSDYRLQLITIAHKHFTVLFLIAQIPHCVFSFQWKGILIFSKFDPGLFSGYF
nr:MAG TPA: hypothetical protein [Caudoviricetes sp.]